VDDALAAGLQRELGLQEIIALSLRLYRAYPVLFAVLALGVVAPYALIELAVTGSGPLASSGGHSAALRTLFELLSITLTGPLISALHVHAVVAVAEGQPPRLARVASVGARVLPVVAATEIIVNLGIGVGLLAFIVPGVLLLLRWSVAAQAAAVEREGWLPALRSSADLTSGHYGHVLAVLLVVALVVAAVTLPVRAIPLGSTSGVGSVALGIAVSTLAASFGALTSAVLFFDLRARAKAPRPPRAPDFQRPRDLVPSA